MKWTVDFSYDSLDFLSRNNLNEGTVIDKIKLALRKFSGEKVNINIKKLKGEWEGFYRIRVGKLRIIIEFNFERCQAHVERIDWRGSVYK